MDRETLLAHFENPLNHKPTLRLRNGGVVVGTQIDQENHLWYIIDRSGGLSLEDAEGQVVDKVLIEHPPHKTTVKNLPNNG